MSTTPSQLYPSRMTLDLNEVSALPRISTLLFPYQQALDQFVSAIRRADERVTPKRKYPLKPPARQLNDAILALAPGLIHAFEDIWIDGQKTSRMVAFTGAFCPSTDQLADLIRVWLTLWTESNEVKGYVQQDAKTAWEEMKQALKNPAESDWQHNIKPQELLSNLNDRNSLGYAALPALIIAQMHGRTQMVQGANQPYEIRWRRAHEGGAAGLYLLSQIFIKDEDAFSYRLDVHMQTQTGRTNVQGQELPWVYVDLGMQRYISARFQRDKFHQRNLSILLGYNRERFEAQVVEAANAESGADETPVLQLWEPDTTLIQLSVKDPNRAPVWDSGVGELLHRYGLRSLRGPAEILQTPRQFGVYDQEISDRNEYYPIFAEGREFGTRGRRHNVESGYTLTEMNEVLTGWVEALNGLLRPAEPFERDGKILKGKLPLVLRSYEFISKKRKDMSPFHKATQEGVQRVLDQIGQKKLHIMIVYQTAEFKEAAEQALRDVLLLEPNIESSQVIVSACHAEAPLYLPLDSGGRNYNECFGLKGQKWRDFMRDWNAQMSRSYTIKRKAWQTFLKALPWKKEAYRMVLIDSLGDRYDDPNVHESQGIKGAIRDACHQENIASQFAIGGFEKKTPTASADSSAQSGKASEAAFSSEIQGKMQNSALDLLVRQTGLLYGLPSEVYGDPELVGLASEIASELDIIGFYRMDTNDPSISIHYPIAVRVSAAGHVDVMWPTQMTWTPYLKAAREIGKLFSQTRGSLYTSTHALSCSQADMTSFVRSVLTEHLDHPAIAVIEAANWRNGRGNPSNHGWTQLRNLDLTNNLDGLNFGRGHVYQRAAPALKNLVAVVRLRMNDETPQYLTQIWNAEDDSRDVAYLSGYVDCETSKPLHYFSVAGLPNTQKKQGEAKVYTTYKQDEKSDFHEIAIKHAQLIEMVPFFVREDFQHEIGQRQICRVIHLSRIAPGFTSGEVLLPYSIHLGKKLLEDQLCVVGAE